MSDSLTRLLLVEDNLTDAALVLSSLDDKRFDVVIATSIAEALEFLARDEDGFDVGLVDLDLPDAAGLDTPRRLLAHPMAPPLVVISGHVDDALIQSSLRIGVEEVVDKSDFMHPGTLERALLRALARSSFIGSQLRYARSMQVRNRSLRRGMERLAHDLRNPFVAVRGYAQTLARPDLSAELREHIHDDLVALADRTIELLDGIALDQQLDGIRERVDLHEVLREAQEMLEPEFSQSGGSVTVDELPPVWGFVQPIRHMLLTILDNSLRHRVPDQAPHVRVYAELSDAGETIVIGDNGPGVPENRLPHLFEVGEITGPDSPGTFGLASVDATMDRHDGSAHGRLSEAGGLEVVLVFPRRGPTVPGTLTVR